MSQLLTIDIGGSSIKYALFDQGKLSHEGNYPTPDNLTAFYETLEKIKTEFQGQALEGVAIACPGAVNKAKGVIEGASALPYIHHFEIFKDFEALFGLPISVENDANCAALAEMGFGVAKDYKNVLFLVLGTGVGGSVILDGKIHHGAHLYGGEFGIMLMDDQGHTFSELGSTVRLEWRYQERTGQTIKAPEIFERAFAGEAEAKVEVELFFDIITKGIFNLQYAFDPELVVIGGGVSQASFLIPELNRRLIELVDRVSVADIVPVIASAQFKNAANLLGAAVDFELSYPK